MEQIHEHFAYNNLITDYYGQKDDIDAIMDILYDTLNTAKTTVTINRDPKPREVVISSLMKLDGWSIMYAIDQFIK